jgi:hypothetical protein
LVFLLVLFSPDWNANVQQLNERTRRIHASIEKPTRKSRKFKQEKGKEKEKWTLASAAAATVEEND